MGLQDSRARGFPELVGQHASFRSRVTNPSHIREAFTQRAWFQFPLSAHRCLGQCFCPLNCRRQSKNPLYWRINLELILDSEAASSR
jgi:hypothetical protein